MLLQGFAAALLAAAAQVPLPELKVEAASGGSIFYVRNVASQPLTAYLIELVDYPGSSYALWQDEVAAEPVPPGGEKRIPVSNMMVGAVPDYVKLQAALYADGSAGGIPGKIAQIVERRRAVLEATRELIRRLEKAPSQEAAVAELRQWSQSMPPPTRANRNSQAAINQAAAKMLIGDTVARLAGHSREETLTALRAAEKALAASKPAL